MANERRLISVCGECSNYDWKKHKCRVCSCEESDPRSPFYDDCPLPKGVEVVRCKDCKWWNKAGCAIRIVDDSDKPTENDFCSFGERRCE